MRMCRHHPLLVDALWLFTAPPQRLRCPPPPSAPPASAVLATAEPAAAAPAPPLAWPGVGLLSGRLPSLPVVSTGLGCTGAP